MASGVVRDIDVLIAGHACLDIIPSFPTRQPMKPEEVFRPGKLVIVGGASVCLGGPVSNTGVGMAKLGAKVYFVTRLGDDMFGETTMGLMSQVASTEGIHVVSGEESSYTVAIAPPGIDRIFFHNPGTNNTFGPDDVNLELCSRAKVFHLGYPPLMRNLYENDGAQLIEIFRRVRETGAITSLDMALPDPSSAAGKVNWAALLEKLMPYVDFYLPSIEESLFMVDRPKYDQLASTPGDIIDKLDGADYTELSDKLLAWGAKVVALKSGHRGFYCRTTSKAELAKIGVGSSEDWSDKERWTPAFVVENIASATGSGDSAVAGFLVAFLRKESFQQCLRSAVSMGYQNLHGLDGTSGIHDWDYTSAIASDMTKAQIPFQLRSDGWRFCEELKTWCGPKDQSH